eukprot:CAMPEP_0202960144 /NCGR_PEP_ID=MMETSP1396-20130829/4288_1 /ASSEMBLY_ACC=CAM_ASM_000872 /TAXON_ID= /ORGANISM="Pseudokeronopsis sp., Strain Brazil" /LENGTH=77 /DNA_ID=CAMNT_0049679151 /DNA_START=146 /DNA_END=379 /DNA_ORIENTATION=+
MFDWQEFSWLQLLGMSKSPSSPNAVNNYLFPFRACPILSGFIACLVPYGTNWKRNAFESEMHWPAEFQDEEAKPPKM